MEKETSGKCAETPTRAKSRTPFSLTLRGKAEGVGRAGRRGGGGETGRTKELGAHTHARPRVPRHGLLRGLHVPGGAASGAVRGVGDFRPHDDPALGLQRLGRSEDRKAARSRCRFADRAEVSGRGGKRFRARGVSRSHSQPCGSRTRRSCCNQSQDRPIVLARSRLLGPGSARPGRPWPSAPCLSPA